jgi:four helix bundle protein
VRRAAKEGTGTTLNRIEDIEAWQEARRLVGRIYGTTRQGVFSRDFGLCDQVQRAAVSVMANIAEGFGRRSHREFANFLNVARASTAEVSSHLYVALDQGYLAQETFDELLDRCDHVSRMLQKLIHRLGA